MNHSWYKIPPISFSLVCSS